MTVENIVRLTSYLTDPSFADVTGQVRVAALGGRVIPTTAIVVQTVGEGWPVEVIAASRAIDTATPGELVDIDGR